jgi:iron complex outermembrane recepter protein
VSGAFDWQDDLTDTMTYFANLNFSYESSKFVQVHNLAETGAAFLLGARVGVGGERWEVALFGRNLTDDDTIPLATRWFDLRHGFAPRVGGPAGIPPAQVSMADTGLPRAFFAALRKSRTFGIEAKLKF